MSSREISSPFEREIAIRFNYSRSGMLMVAISLFLLTNCTQDTSKTGEIEATVKLDSALMIPDFTIATIEDSTTFNSSDFSKEGLVLLKYFSPDCNHCQEEAEKYVSKKDSLHNIKTIWVSGDWAPLDSIRKFVDTYQLGKIDPVAVGKEASNYLLSHYKIEGIPYNAVFKDNQLLKEYSHLDFGELIAINSGEFVPDTISVAKSVQ